MHNLRNLLRLVASASQHIAAMQNQAVAYGLASQIKTAANFGSIDYVDIADTCADYIADAKPGDFVEQDIDRLYAIGRLLMQAHTALHATQNQILAAENAAG